MKILLMEVSDNKMTVLAMVGSVFYVDKVNVGSTPEEVVLEKNVTGKVYCTFEDAINDWNHRIGQSSDKKIVTGDNLFYQLRRKINSIKKGRIKNGTYC